MSRRTTHTTAPGREREQEEAGPQEGDNPQAPHEDDAPHRTKRPPRFRRWLRKLVSFLAACTLLLIIALVGMLLYMRTQSLPAITVFQTTQVLDIRGALIDDYHNGQNRQVVKLEDISPFLVNATLAIEDHRFFDHFGFDIQSMARAVLVDIQHMSKVQGASTITQQLARNLYLSHERTWARKMKEAFYTAQLELQFSKRQILELYLNQIYYGHAAYGIQSAAQMYFNKDAKDLTLAESALLAGVPKGPKYYSPYMDPANAKKRQKIVLDAMVENGYISPQQENEAVQENLVYQPLTGDQPTVAPYFRDYIKNMAIDKLGISEQAFSQGGIKIYTTLDLDMQKAAEDAVANNLRGSQDDLQSALIAIDPRNGYVKAMVGGKDYKQNQFNRVFTDTRQPGSAFKPILYLTALQQPPFSAVTQFKSEPTVFTYDNGRKTYMPSNFGNHYPYDYIDLRQAIAKSDNIYAVSTIMQVGADKVIDMARRMGIDSPMNAVPSLALGTFPVSPFEMASAFGIIANQGVRVEPTAILRIEDANGDILYEAAPAKTKVIEPAYTYVLTQLMESVFEDGGTGSRVAPTLRRPVAGKSGTTNTDAWMVGFTPELATAVWVGYDRDKTISALESYKAAPIFAEFTENALRAVPPKLFTIPEGVVSVYIDPVTGKLATADCPGARLEAFVKGTEPQETCTLHGSPADPPADDADKNKKRNSSWWNDLKRWWNN